MRYEAIQRQVIEWAAEREDIRAVLLAGSLARAVHPADAFSDLDLVLFTTAPALYRTADALPALPGQTLHIREETWPDGAHEYMVLLAQGESLLKVDLAFPGQNRLTQMAENGLEPPYDRGYAVLLDKDGTAGRLPPPGTAQPFAALPEQAEFTRVVGEFFYDALAAAKQIRRGNLWLVKVLDGQCKRHLLTMLEWQTLAARPGADVWHDGRLMREWLDAGIWAALPGLFGGFDAAGSSAALRQTVALFRTAAQQVAARWGFDYPAIDEKVSAAIEAL